MTWNPQPPHSNNQNLNKMKWTIFPDPVEVPTFAQNSEWAIRLRDKIEATTINDKFYDCINPKVKKRTPTKKD